ncbi:hypothetical protein ACJJTC_011318 [Scirpophaga incertulas]
MKLAAKANLSHHYKETFLTGGGSKPPSPSPEDLQIMAIAPHDFVMNVNNFDSDAAIQPAIVDGPIAGPSSEEPLIVIVPEELSEPKSDIKDDGQIVENVISPSNRGSEVKKNKKTGKKQNVVLKNKGKEGRQAIIDSNINFKKPQLELLEIEHKYKTQISKLKIKKLNQEIEILQKQL